MHRHDPAPFLVGGLTLPEYNLSAIQRLPYVSAAEAIREYEATAPSGAEALRLEREAAKAEAARQKEAQDLRAEVARLRARLATLTTPPRPPRTVNVKIGGCVYFVRAGEHVKIGHTAGRVHKRLAQLQIGNPYRLELIGTMAGGPQQERAMHRRFAHLRAHGEWFQAAPDLLAAIAEVA
jgi:hypothetical protein